MKKNLLFTFDYELFLGVRSGTVSDCMIDPTNRLIAIFDEFRISAIFFVDATYLVRLSELAKRNEKCRADFNLIVSQLRTLISKGHYVYPHIHPHWLDAEYIEESNQWKLSTVKRYRFHNLTDEERRYVFSSSIAMLNDIIKEADPGYVIDGFRAGGWSLQPFSDFKPFFIQYGIKYDFSVLPGTYQFSNAQHFDFTLAPQKPVYNFEDDVSLEQPDGRFTELVSSIIYIPPTVSFLHKLQLRWLYHVAKDHTYGKGQGQRSVELSQKPAGLNGSNIRNPLTQPVSIETLSMVKLPSYYHYFRQHSYMQFVSHPKMLSFHSIRTLRRFLSVVTRKYEVESDFKSFIKSAVELL